VSHFKIGQSQAKHLHDADSGEHRRPTQRRDQDQGFHRRLPFLGFVLGLRQLRDVLAGNLKGDELATAGKRDRIVERPFPTAIATSDPGGSRLLVPIEVRPDVGALGTAGLTGEPGLYVG
jgi:hypothetical protein